MSYRLVTVRDTPGTPHPLLDPEARGTLVLDHAYGPVDCSTCDNGISLLAQIILKRDELLGVFAVLCPACAPKHVEAARARGVAFVRRTE